MASLLKSILSHNSGGIHNSPSFSDLSMGASADAEDFSKEHPDTPTSAQKEKIMGTSPTRTNVWQSTFNPRKNASPQYKTVGNQYFDHVPDKTGEYSVWDHVVKGERMKIFHSFDKDHDGYLNASDLEQSFGRTADVKQMIAAADRNGDGKIDYAEFCELLRNS
ncbi:probable calcium-dependent protein kinase [Coccomyxa sp. Obi]|nr:probable calcium-dependent protein kinase [Coccomyxa sp. Obi]